MNEIVITFLLVGDRFMLEMHLRETGFAYTACGPFTKNKERAQKFKETRNSWYIYQSKLEKDLDLDHMTYGNFKDLTKQLLIKYCFIRHLIFLKFQNMMEINANLLHWSIDVLTKRIRAEQLKVRICQTNN